MPSEAQPPCSAACCVLTPALGKRSLFVCMRRCECATGGPLEGPCDSIRRPVEEGCCHSFPAVATLQPGGRRERTPPCCTAALLRRRFLFCEGGHVQASGGTLSRRFAWDKLTSVRANTVAEMLFYILGHDSLPFINRLVVKEYQV